MIVPLRMVCSIRLVELEECLLHESFKNGVFNVILQHSLIVSALRVTLA